MTDAAPFDPPRLARSKRAMVGDPVSTLDDGVVRPTASSTIVVGDGATLYAGVVEEHAEKGPSLS